MTRREGQLFFGVAVAIVLAMGASIHNGFVYDDVPIIVNNPLVTDPSRWHDIFRSTYWPGALWRPVTVSGYALQWYLGHGAPWLFHVVSLALYFLLAWSVFRLLREVSASLGAAVAAVLIFVVHPVHVEVVANVVGQAELWTATSLVMATWLYLRMRRLGTTLPRQLALLGAVTIATMTKEQGFIAPLILVGAEWLLVSGSEETWRDRIRPLVPAMVVTMFMLLVRSTVTGTLKGEITAVALAHLGFRDRLVTFLATVPEYARLLVWPIHLRAEYSPPAVPMAGPVTATHLVGVVLIALMVAVLVHCRRRAPLMSFGLWWAAVAMGPVSSVFAAAGFVMAERVFFLPSLGFAIALAGGLSLLKAIRPLRVQVMANLLLGMWIVGATVRSAMRVPVWHDQDRFFAALPTDGPRDYRASLVAGRYWYTANRMGRAEQDLREALRLWPYDAGTNESLGQLMRVSGRCGEAVPVFVQGLAVEPDRTSLRAKLLECLIALGDRATALTVAEAGIALGDSSFIQTKRRLQANPEFR